MTLLLLGTQSPSSVAAAPAPDVRFQAGEPIYALPGTLQPAQGQPFTTFFVDRDGFFYVLVGESVDVQNQIDALAAQNSSVKVWGTLYREGRATQLPEIIASAVQANPTSSSSGDQIYVVVEMGRINVRSSPNVNAVPVGQLDSGARCPVLERTSDEKWYRIACEDGHEGWVSSQLVTVSGDPSTVASAPTATPIPQPTQVPTPSPAPVAWTTSYYNDRDLSGAPVATADLPQVNFNWGVGSPHPAVSADNFSLRMEQFIDFPAGNYRFLARADDGVRVYVNGQLIINDWVEGPARELRADRYVSGPSQIVIEYFEATGLAELQFGYATLRIGEWAVNYFTDMNLSSDPVYINVEPGGTSIQLDRDWGEASPYPGRVGSDYWSASWEGTFFFAAGAYDFRVRSDDGVRVYLNDQLVFDRWLDGYKEETLRLNAVGEGYHTVRVEFYEKTGTALVMVAWRQIGTTNIQ